MNCTGVLAVSPVCQLPALIGNGASRAADGAFSAITTHFTVAATDATTWLWQELDTATSLDLTSPGLLHEMAATAAIAGVLCFALFLIQIITSVLRREPGGLGRAVTGLVTSFIGSALALVATRALLGAVDALSAGVVAYTLDTNIAGIGAMLDFTKLASVQNPAVALLFAAVILVAVVIVWAAMMVRKMMLLIAAVLAPLAFAGATADITRAWTRRWIEFVCAMVVSKLLLVIILSIGVSVLTGAGQGGGGITQTGTQLAAGSLILLMGGFSPWIAIKMFSFAGDTLHAAHLTASQASSGARTVVAAPQKVAALHWQVGKLAGASSAATATQRLPQQPTGANSTTTEPAATGDAPRAPDQKPPITGTSPGELPTTTEAVAARQTETSGAPPDPAPTEPTRPTPQPPKQADTTPRRNT
jgi:type IV secretion system protein TrbL